MTGCSEPNGGSHATLSLGSNLGDRLAWLRQALDQLAAADGLTIVAVSSVYETDPVGLTDQPLFYNIVIQVHTTLDPFALLRVCQAVEIRLQRQRSVHWGPRTIDIDLLTYDDRTLATPELVLPHPRMQDRAFVQIPLQELATGQVGCGTGVRPVITGWYDGL
jgi:2-amino-4-hydroxy-6-hydroxymethyldihydropteridine diphosphokinase